MSPPQSYLVRQLKLFAWSLLLINMVMVALGIVAGRHLEQWSDGFIVLVAIAVLVDGAFLIVVGGNLLAMAIVALLRRFRQLRP